MRILIAEDDPIIQRVHQSMLSQWGYEYDMARNGRDALALAIDNRGCYDLALLDVEMPEMDGIEAARQIRQNVKYFPIIAYSSDNRYKAACIEAGMDIFLQKPCTPDRLQALLKQFTLKLLACLYSEGQITLELAKPMNNEELKELMELESQGLAKFSLIGTDYKFVVHKNLQNKLSHDFVGEGKELSEFLDRNPENPGIIHVYANNLHATKRHITPSLLSQLQEEENAEMTLYTARTEYPNSNDE
jgi:CheY-like chemotaxis protein